MWGDVYETTARTYLGPVFTKLGLAVHGGVKPLIPTLGMDVVVRFQSHAHLQIKFKASLSYMKPTLKKQKPNKTNLVPIIVNSFKALGSSAFLLQPPTHTVGALLSSLLLRATFPEFFTIFNSSILPVVFSLAP